MCVVKVLLIILLSIAYGRGSSIKKATIENYTYTSSGKEIMNYTSAVYFCETLDLQLIEIHSQDEMDRIYKFTEMSGIIGRGHWIAGTYEKYSDKFQWRNSKAPIAYKNFGPGQPDTTNTGCIALHKATLKWEVNNCSDAHLALCGNSAFIVTSSIVYILMTFLLLQLF